MSEAEEYLRKSEEYLRLATATDDLHERGRLLHAAAYWNEQARDAEDRERMACRRSAKPSSPGAA